MCALGNVTQFRTCSMYHVNNIIFASSILHNLHVTRPYFSGKHESQRTGKEEKRNALLPHPARRGTA